MKRPNLLAVAVFALLLMWAAVLFQNVVAQHQNTLAQQRNLQVDQLLITERAALDRRVTALEARADHNDKAYGNRGIIQQSLKNKAIAHGWYESKELSLIEQSAALADYPPGPAK